MNVHPNQQPNAALHRHNLRMNEVRRKAQVLRMQAYSDAYQGLTKLLRHLAQQLNHRLHLVKE